MTTRTLSPLASFHGASGDLRPAPGFCSSNSLQLGSYRLAVACSRAGSRKLVAENRKLLAELSLAPAVGSRLPSRSL
jgi:hypothetical protein